MKRTTIMWRMRNSINWRLVARIREAKNAPYKSGSVTINWEHYGKVLEAKDKANKS